MTTGHSDCFSEHSENLRRLHGRGEQERPAEQALRTLIVRRGELPPNDLVSYERPTVAPPGFQATFDIMVRSMMATQIVPAKTRDGKARYRTQDGLVCPVGALIPAGAYSGDLEGLSALDPFLQQLLRRRGHNAGLCWSLQVIHDHIPPKEWPRFLRETAEWFRLSTQVVDELADQFLARWTVAP